MLANDFFRLANIDFPAAFGQPEPYFVFAPEIGQAIETTREPDGIHVIVYDTSSRETLAWLIVCDGQVAIKEKPGHAETTGGDGALLEVAQQMKTIVDSGCERE